MTRCKECSAPLHGEPVSVEFGGPPDVCEGCYALISSEQRFAEGYYGQPEEDVDGDPYLRMRVFELEREGPVREVDGFKLDDEMLMRLIRLTHPDLHPQERQEEANELTAALLAFRRRNRR